MGFKVVNMVVGARQAAVSAAYVLGSTPPSGGFEE